MKIKHTSISNSTLNPIFPEHTIVENPELNFAREDLDNLLSEVAKMEENEIDVFKTKNLMDFKPSENLVEIIKKACFVRLREEWIVKDICFKIEANIAVHCGRLSISEAYSEYKDKNRNNKSPLYESYGSFYNPDGSDAVESDLVANKYKELFDEKLKDRWSEDISVTRMGGSESKIPSTDSFWNRSNLWDNLPLLQVELDIYDEENKNSYMSE